MLKRTIVLTNPLALSLKNAQLVMTSEALPDGKHTVPIEDVGMVVVENQQISLTMPLLNELIDAGVAVVLCDRKGMPHAMLQNLDSNNLQGEMLRNQINVSEPLRKQLWKQLIEAKILSITDKQYSNIINIWGEIEQKVPKKPVQLEFF